MRTESKNVSPSRALLPRLGGLLAAIVLLMVMLAPAQAQTATPYMYIESVVQGSTVTLTAYNLPPNQSFDVRMGPMGTLGINGTHVGTTPSGTTGSFTMTYAIPAALAGHYQIAIRMDSPQGYYAYNWFYNNTTGGTGGTPGYVGIPTFSIGSVIVDDEVTIIPYNFPANQTFTVTIGEMWTQGIGGYVAGTITTDAYGVPNDVTFDIPPALYGRAQLSIRTQTAHAYPYYSYNWFNNVPGGTLPPGHGGQPTTTIPTFNICKVDEDISVTIKTYNFPPNQTFNVTMGYMGTLGINGTPVGQITTDASGVPTTATSFAIPSYLWDQSQVSIRAQTAHTYPYNPYYSYNWFYNNTADVTSTACP